MNLSQVSRTSILLLICRAIEAQRDNSEFNDPMAVLCLERLMSLASEEEKRWIIKRKRYYEGIQARDAKAGVHRVQAFDNIANRFIADNPRCTVINLACGFDTRFWRIDHAQCNYIEMDLPEVIDLKKEILKDHLRYEMIGSSVLEPSWIDQVTMNGNTDFLLIAEGLFHWIPQIDAQWLLKEIGERFSRSQLILDMVHERNTSREYGKVSFVCTSELIRVWMSPGYLVSRIRQDLESYGNGLKVIGQERGSAGPIICVSINAAL